MHVWIKGLTALAAMTMALSACTPAAEEAAAPPAGPPVRAAFDPYRPCTLLDPQEVKTVTGRPVHQLLADNRVLGDGVMCSYSVGEGGMHGYLQLTVIHAADGETADDYLARRCEKAVEKTAEACRLASGLLVQRAGAVAVEASVQDMMGAVQPAESQALMGLVAPRLGAGAT